jgi:hypothetical protein
VTNPDQHKSELPEVSSVEGGSSASQPKLAGGFTFKDYVTIGLSTLALGLSGLTFYMTNFFIDHRASARLVTVDQLGSGLTDHVEMAVAVVNSGNRPVAILNFGFSIEEKEGEAGGVNGPNERDPRLPLILAPHEIHMLTLKIPSDWFIGSFNNGLSIPKPDPGIGLRSADPTQAADQDAASWRRLFLTYNIEALDSEGISYENCGIQQVKVDVSSLDEIIVRGAPSYPALDLFANCPPR